jgi:hypothetical protein
MTNILSNDEIDFKKYLRETDAKANVKNAAEIGRAHV